MIRVSAMGFEGVWFLGVHAGMPTYLVVPLGNDNASHPNGGSIVSCPRRQWRHAPFRHSTRLIERATIRLPVAHVVGVVRAAHFAKILLVSKPIARLGASF